MCNDVPPNNFFSSHLTDKNECEESYDCALNEICVNTVGSYNCTCAPGFTQNVTTGDCIGEFFLKIIQYCLNDVVLFRAFNLFLIIVGLLVIQIIITNLLVSLFLLAFYEKKGKILFIVN